MGRLQEPLGAEAPGRLNLSCAESGQLLLQPLLLLLRPLQGSPLGA